MCDHCVCYLFLIFFIKKQPSLLLNGEVLWQASDSSLSKELHVSSIKYQNIGSRLPDVRFVNGRNEHQGGKLDERELEV